jgi:hypothetical protein
VGWASLACIRNPLAAQQPTSFALPAHSISVTATQSIAKATQWVTLPLQCKKTSFAPEECCFDEVDALLWHQARDDSDHRLVRVLVKTQALPAAAAATAASSLARTA